MRGKVEDLVLDLVSMLVTLILGAVGLLALAAFAGVWLGIVLTVAFRIVGIEV